jgi:uncharacterized membrane protein
MARDQRRDGRARSTVISLLDIALVVGIALVTYLCWQYTAGWAAPLRVGLGVALVVVLPGYVVTAAMFPERDRQGGSTPGALSPLERFTLSVGLSVIVVPLLLLFLNFTRWGITPGPARLSVLAFTLAVGAVAAVRRLRLPPTHRFALPVGQWVRTAGSGATRVDIVIGVLLVLSVAVAGSALVQPGDSETFTEFYLLSENESGALVADDYPSERNRSENGTVHVGLRNAEGHTMNYTVVVEVQEFRSVDGERIVTSRTELDRYRTELQPGDSNRTEQQFSPPTWIEGGRFRLTFLLYTGSVAENPRIDDAYRKSYIWVDVPAREAGA